MYYEIERTRIYAPRRYLRVIFILRAIFILAIFALAVGWLRRRGGEFLDACFRRTTRRSRLRACGRSRTSDRSRRCRGGRCCGDLMGRVAIAGSMDQSARKKAVGRATCLGTSSCLASVCVEGGFGEGQLPEIGGVRGDVLISLDGSTSWT